MDDKDLKLIVQDIVSPIVMKAMEEMNNVNEQVDTKIVQCITELASRLNSYRIEVAKNVSFIKSVLIQNGLTTQDVYDKYIQEWERLNAPIIRNASMESVFQNNSSVESNTPSTDNND